MVTLLWWALFPGSVLCRGVLLYKVYFCYRCFTILYWPVSMSIELPENLFEMMFSRKNKENEIMLWWFRWIHNIDFLTNQKQVGQTCNIFIGSNDILSLPKFLSLSECWWYFRRIFKFQKAITLLQCHSKCFQ